MAYSSVSSTEYDHQVDTCKEFFARMKQLEIDITGFDAYRVIAQMCYMVNHQQWVRDSDPFRFLIRGTSGDKVFNIEPNPTLHQPGNGRVSLQGKKGKSWVQISKILIGMEGRMPPHSFATKLMTLFQDNQQIFQEEDIIAEVYALLLFEIARRFHRKLNSPTQKSFDCLPIGVAIVRMLKLFRYVPKGFQDFEKDGVCFDIFLRQPEDRTKAIERINEAYKKAHKHLPSADKETDLKTQLEDMYCRKPSQEKAETDDEDAQGADVKGITESLKGMSASSSSVSFYWILSIVVQVCVKHGLHVEHDLPNWIVVVLQKLERDTKYAVRIKKFDRLNYVRLYEKEIDKVRLKHKFPRGEGGGGWILMNIYREEAEVTNW